VFVLVLVLLNTLVATTSCFSSLVFQSVAVRNGQWWRLFTYPFVHVTWYHLLLDGSAFLMLYQSLLAPKLGSRLTYVFAGGAASLLVSWNSPNGLCGLSGIAHGLMAVSALELVANHPASSAERRLGLISFLLVVAKAAFEAGSSRMVFSFLDFGLLGQPVAVAHAGGIMGSLIAMLFLGSRRPHYISVATPKTA